MDVSKMLKGLPKSKLTVNELVDMTHKNFFKLGISTRTSNLGSLKYIGFKYTFHRDTDDKLVVFVNLYFYMKGANADLYKKKDGTIGARKRKPRETYMLVAKFPYSQKVKNMKRLYDVPLQIFSSDPSFKYYFAYALNKLNAVVTDDGKLVDWLGESLIKAPKQNNPNLTVQLTKHFFKFFKFIANNRPKQYMDDKYLIRSDAKIINRK
jgi:hypothetical protein